jgi:hypothetical protein
MPRREVAHFSKFAKSHSSSQAEHADYHETGYLSIPISDIVAANSGSGALNGTWVTVHPERIPGKGKSSWN